ncbi:MAG: SRPBCC domain-containing protein [Archangium gephyra]|uniref:SRPBCC domain-containing protein n=1 Tax=Archangium gephyra TaxID=48 RepID=A0A2W5TFC9_9BACT|nr:MAG: SRPBCC domain-containing protein [Archangium gephyra]
MSPPSARATIDIAAPISTVWNALINLEAYPTWNPFVVKVDGASSPRVGDRLVLHVKWPDGSGMKIGQLVTRVDAPGERAELAWRFQGLLPSLKLVRAERTQTLTRLDDNTTRYESVEAFTGLLARFVPLERVIRRFEDNAKALADFVTRVR